MSVWSGNTSSFVVSLICRSIVRLYKDGTMRREMVLIDRKHLAAVWPFCSLELGLHKKVI